MWADTQVQESLPLLAFSLPRRQACIRVDQVTCRHRQMRAHSQRNTRQLEVKLGSAGKSFTTHETLPLHIDLILSLSPTPTGRATYVQRKTQRHVLRVRAQPVDGGEEGRNDGMC